MNIKVRDLKQTETVETSNIIMVLVDRALNLVKNITIEEFLASIISKEANNVISQDADGKLYSDGLIYQKIKNITIQIPVTGAVANTLDYKEIKVLD